MKNTLLLIENDIPDNSWINEQVYKTVERAVDSVSDTIQRYKIRSTEDIENFIACEEYNNHVAVVINNATSSFNDLDVISSIVGSGSRFLNNSVVVVIISSRESTNESEYFKHNCIDVVKYPYDESVVCSRIRAHYLRGIQYSNLLDKISHDGLTNLFTKEHALYLIEIEISRSERTGAPFSILMIDIDWFKRINDTYGHVSGDAVIKSVANILKGNTRITDYAARYGGEEFLMVLSATDIAGAVCCAEKIRHNVENIYIMSKDKSKINCTVSIGAAEFDKTKSVLDNIAEADKQLYEAKRCGRNRVKADPMALERALMIKDRQEDKDREESKCTDSHTNQDAKSNSI